MKCVECLRTVERWRGGNGPLIDEHVGRHLLHTARRELNSRKKFYEGYGLDLEDVIGDGVAYALSSPNRFDPAGGGQLVAYLMEAVKLGAWTFARRQIRRSRIVAWEQLD